MSIFKKIAAFIIFILITTSSFAVEPALLKAVKIQPSASFTTISFILSKKTYGGVKYFSDENKILVDFTNTEKKIAIQNAKLTGSNIKTISTNEANDKSLQFIILVKDKISWKIKFLSSGEKDNEATLILDIKSLNALSDKSAPRKKEHAKVTTKKPVAALIDAKKTAEMVVVIDAGHGGRDTGAIGPRGEREKDVVLGISKRLAKLINNEPGMRAVLTRKGDYFVPLRSRIKLARKGDADLFIAIHADAFFNKRARGVSVFALSHRGATSEAARWLAQKENHSELGDIELNALQDRSPVLRSVLIDLAQTATIQDSLKLGNKMLDALDDVSVLHHKHVDQAPFVVLKSPDIPSVLIETGFITNPHEERLLASAYYQEKLAKAIFSGLKQYKRQYSY